MKTIQTVLQTLAMAEARACFGGRTGVAKVSRKVVGNVKYDTPQEVYRVEYTKTTNYNLVDLYHFGTKTLSLALGFGDDKHITHVYGESRTDADSINTVLHREGFTERYTYKPVNGGFQEVEVSEYV